MDSALVTLITGLAGAVVGATGALVAFRNGTQSDRAKLVDQYAAMAEEVRAENNRLVDRVEQLGHQVHTLENKVEALIVENQWLRDQLPCKGDPTKMVCLPAVIAKGAA